MNALNLLKSAKGRHLSPVVPTGAYYIASDGNDTTGDGTSANPYRSLSKVATVVQPGDTIYLRGGWYDSLTDDVYQNQIEIRGTEAANITIRSYPGEWAVFDGKNHADWPLSEDAGKEPYEPYVLYLTLEWVNFEYLELRNSTGSGMRVYAADSKFRYLVAQNNHADGMRIYGSRNEIAYCLSQDNYSISNGGNSGNGYVVMANATYETLFSGDVAGEDNHFHHNIGRNCSDDGFNFVGCDVDNIVEHTVMFENGYGSTGNGNGLKLGLGTGDTVTNVTRYNIGFSNSQYAIQTNGPTGNLIHNNVGYDNDLTISFYEGTAGSGDNEGYNNLSLYPVGGYHRQRESGVTNHLDNAGYTGRWDPAGGEGNFDTIDQDPVVLSLDWTNADFLKLGATSPYLSAGRTTDYLGNPISDISTTLGAIPDGTEFASGWDWRSLVNAYPSHGLGSRASMDPIAQTTRTPYPLSGEEVDPSPSPSEQTSTFTEDTSTDFMNPERGWCERVHHDSSKYLNLRDGDTEVPQGYTVNWPYMGFSSKDHAWGSGVGGTTETPFRLDNYLDADLPQSLLDELVIVFNRARTAGIKLKVRFMYDWGSSGANDRALDATAYWTMRHMTDLATVVNAHRDIILGVEGFWGKWAEHNRSGYLGTSSPYNGSYGDWWGSEFEAAYTDVVDHAMSEFHETIPFSWRYNWHAYGLRGYFDGADASHPNWSTYDFEGNRGNRSYADRTGQYNDCLWNTGSHGGTFNNSDDELSAKRIGRTNFMSGETCGSDTTESSEYYVMNPAAPRSAWDLGMDVLYRKYSDNVYNAWISDGFYDEFSLRLGYRLVLDSITLPTTVSAGGTLDVSMDMRNVGFGKVYKERPIDLVFVGSGGPFTTRVTSDARSVLPLGGGDNGSTGTSETIEWTGVSVPAGLQSGQSYDVYLRLPDPDPLDNGLANDVRYCIRLANTGIWDGNTGRHDLNVSVTVS